MTLVSDVLRYLQRHLVKIAGPLVLVSLLLITSCSSSPPVDKSSNEVSRSTSFAPRPVIKQVEPPALIRELSPWLDKYEPQVQLLQPQADQILDDTSVNVVLQVQGLSIYKDEI